MRSSLICFLLILFAQMVWAQGSKLSPATRSLLRETESYRNNPNKSAASLPEKVVRQYLLQQKDGQYYVSGLLKVDAGTDDSQLEAAGAEIRTSTRTIRTFRISLEALPRLAEVPGVRYVQIDEGVKKKLKEAIAETNTIRVHRGDNPLPRPYDGTGVVVGVIDIGFDASHPAFRSADGSRLRVKRHWFEGRSLETEAEILGTLTDSMGATHGTHVACIAAGSNWKAPIRELTGYAPGADLVWVSLNEPSEPGQDITLESLVLDGVEYIFDYATAQGKPAVINMSLGTHLGPHDGTSLLDQGFDELLEGTRGRVLVGAVGNEGRTPLYLEHTFGARDTILTIVQFETHPVYDSPYMGEGQLDIWGTAGKEFKLATVVVDAQTGEPLYASEDFASSKIEGEFLDVYVADEERAAGFLVVVDPAFVGNGKPNMRLRGGNDLDAYVILALTGEPGSTVRIWNHGVGAAGAALVDTLKGGERFPGAKAGTTASTVGEIGGTGRSVITVGAYTTLNRITPVSGQETPIDVFAELGEIAPFSSRGPTADGRVKPDITAPGNVVVAAISSTVDIEEYSERIIYLTQDGDDIFCYAALEGTSMATPGVTGVVALMLQARPDLTFEQVKTILQRTARTDNFTGAIPAAGSNTWGRGKVDAFAAVREAVGTVSMPEKLAAAPAWAFSCFPNPANDVLTVEPTRAGTYTASLHEVTGRCLWTQTLSGTHTFDTRDLSPGLYVLQLAGLGTRQYVKVQIVH